MAVVFKLFSTCESLMVNFSVGAGRSSQLFPVTFGAPVKQWRNFYLCISLSKWVKLISFVL